YYLSEARKYCEKLITVISTDKNVEKIKNHTPVDNQEVRKTSVEKSGIAELVFIGEENNHLKYVEKFQPRVVCLGYDQEGFVGELRNYITLNKLDTEIIRLRSHKPEIYKSSKM
ncbi:hypothetical protein LR004_00550, partial [Candidatus Gracilibacteria bacterium]|nr:hypothetical protein [Candidatus Gracilibacteria bacterium]